MDAFLLAGGLGSRLRKVSGEIPKPLIEINGCRLIDRILMKISEYDCISRIYILAGYKYQLFDEIYQDRSIGKQRIHVLSEENLTGTGGAVVNAFLAVNPQSGFILNADTITETNLEMLHFAAKKNTADGAIACCKLSFSPDYGNVIYDKTFVLQKFNRNDSTIGPTMTAYNGVLNFQTSFVKKLVGNYELRNRLKKRGTLSLEHDILEDRNNKIIVNISKENEFNDVGTPLRYEVATRKLIVAKLNLN